jgi:hypothetical protein
MAEGDAETKNGRMGTPETIADKIRSAESSSRV